MTTHGIEKIASDPIKRASCKWKRLQLVPKANRHHFLVQVRLRRMSFSTPISLQERDDSAPAMSQTTLTSNHGQDELSRKKSLRHSAKQCLDYTGLQTSGVVVMLDKPHQIGWSRSAGSGLYLFLKMKSISGTSRCAPKADFHRHSCSLPHLKLCL